MREKVLFPVLIFVNALLVNSYCETLNLPESSAFSAAPTGTAYSAAATGH